MTSFGALQLLPFLLLTLTIRGRGSYPCEFPGSWEGAWHHLMHTSPLNISLTSIDTKGSCHTTITSDYSGTNKTGFGQFIIKEESGCLKCMIIYQKHFNVLQYRESECLPGGSGQAHAGQGSLSLLGSWCQEIPGDAPMYTMIRVSAAPVVCPLQGPYSLAYGKGGADRQCSHPPSLMDTCNDDSVIQIKYQACPDVEGSESLVERMTCVAKWKEGNKRYFVALVSSRHTMRKEPKDRYHCFLYEDIVGKMRMAQGQFTSSCRGLWSVLEGRRTFSLQKLRRGKPCELPHFLRRHNKWGSLDGRVSLHVDSTNTSFSLLTQATTLEQVSCHSMTESKVESKLVVHVKRGCSSGYMCLSLTSLDDTLVSASYGLRSHHPEEACTHHYFSSTTTSLLVAEAASSPCPFSGSYSVQGRLLQGVEVEGEDKEGCQTVMQAGCDNSHRLELQRQCPAESVTRTLVCHGLGTRQLSGNDSSSSVSESGGASSGGQQQVLVVSEVGKPSSYLCLSYTEVEGRLEASLSYKQCIHNLPNVANVSSSGPCILPLTQENGGDTSSASSASQKSLFGEPLSYQITASLALLSIHLV